MQSLWIRNGKALFPDGRLEAAEVLIEHGRIDAIGARVNRSAPEIDAAGGYVLPGLIDLHTHGIGRDSTETALADFAAEEARCGATAFLPTLFGPPEHSALLMRRHRRETHELRQTPQVAGFRLESPYLAQTGGGLTQDIVPITDTTTEHLLQAAGGHLKIWDMSPEIEHAPALIRRLSRAGIVCSLAHTAATIEQARTAVAAGARLVTHLFDTFLLPVFGEPGVYPAALTDYLLMEDRLVCEIIPDGTHVHPLLVEKTFRCKPDNRLVFVTDSNNGAGLPPGEYELPRRWGRVRIGGANDGVRLIEPGNPERDNALCGSALTPIDGFRNAVRLFGKTMAQASRVCSANPAELLGLNKGVLAPGRDGDVLVLDQELNILYTIVAGTVAHRR